jgi:hypothetical protein
VATLTAISGPVLAALADGTSDWNVHPRLVDCIHLVRSTAARTVLPASGDARHVDGRRAAIEAASVLLRGPVAL